MPATRAVRVNDVMPRSKIARRREVSARALRTFPPTTGPRARGLYAGEGAVTRQATGSADRNPAIRAARAAAYESYECTSRLNREGP